MSEMGDSNPKLRLRSSDDKIVEVDASVARMSGTIRTMLENMDSVGNVGEIEIPTPNVRGDILEATMQWATHHKDDPEPVIEEGEMEDRRTDDICAWDQQFLQNFSQAVLLDLIVAANDLDVKGLLDVTCKTVANMIKGKTVDEVRQAFGVTNDLTAVEQEQVRKENEWCDK